MKASLLAESEGGGLVLDVRFDSSPSPDGSAPIDLTLFVDAAHERVREQYPAFAYELARGTGLLDIPGWSTLRAYWLVPFSERSPLRTPLIEDLYRLSLLEAVIEKHQPTELRVATPDDKLAVVIGRLAGAHGLTMHRVAAPGAAAGAAVRPPRGGARRRAFGALRVLVGRLRLLVEEWAAWWQLRGQAREVLGDGAPRGPVVAFYTRYPVLWERTEGGARERNFGTFPEYLARQGFTVVFPAVLSARGGGRAPTLGEVRAEARALGVVFLESLLSLAELLRTHLDVTHVLRYLQWRRRSRRTPMRFNGLDVRELVLRELDPEFLYGSELLTNYARAYGFERFCRRYRPAVVFHPFESQPMERALWAGVRAARGDTVIVGTQSGMFSSNWLPWIPAPGEVGPPHVTPEPHQSPLADYVVAYGTLAHAAFARHCHRARVLLPGAIRYPGIQRGGQGVRGVDLPDGPCVLVACSADRDETRVLLRVAVDLARARPDVFLLLKFHFHNPMDGEWGRLAETAGVRRYQVHEAGLVRLLAGSRAALLGSSSVAVEAIALGCMPVVLQAPDRYNYSPALDIRDAAFLSYDPAAAVEALDHCIAEDAEYWARRRAWPAALDRMAYRLDGRQDERLLTELRERHVL